MLSSLLYKSPSLLIAFVNIGSHAGHWHGPALGTFPAVPVPVPVTEMVMPSAVSLVRLLSA